MKYIIVLKEINVGGRRIVYMDKLLNNKLKFIENELKKNYILTILI